MTRSLHRNSRCPERGPTTARVPVECTFTKQPCQSQMWWHIHVWYVFKVVSSPSMYCPKRSVPTLPLSYNPSSWVACRPPDTRARSCSIAACAAAAGRGGHAVLGREESHHFVVAHEGVRQRHARDLAVVGHTGAARLGGHVGLALDTRIPRLFHPTVPQKLNLNWRAPSTTVTSELYKLSWPIWKPSPYLAHGPLRRERASSRRLVRLAVLDSHRPWIGVVPGYRWIIGFRPGGREWGE